eukprot:CAMPEP_0172566990 /NCGR_PEP_ID=MMETSP1067-20121228/114074_1 /TAXON_ID=265564 ORGANISM="Thalassiosira punctigera, Strain Tpunct2005C2" /NCGR_SAMPLE_ID=MMETSP1067 /ASSEMBLY_ACC=CAM_ASM_000444 /LENGTH=289 /DNA_ID=CAMNT_0013358239 /DNA_START=8 /DNA_END=877 /DNA_ORIENTATION=+
MSAKSYRSSTRNNSFLDAEALHLSENGALDDFEFLLEEGSNSGERLFDSRGSADLDALLRDSRGSAAMDFDFEALKNSLSSMHVDAIHAGGDPAMSVNMSELTTSSGSSGHPVRHSHIRDRSPSPQKRSEQRRFQLNAVNFDPPSDREQSQPQPQKQQHFGQASHDDQPCAPSSSEEQYNEALQKLAESMKRTEESRKHVMMQRDMLTPAQQWALSSAKERLNRHPPQQQLQVSPPDPQTHTAPRSISPGRSSIMAAFFSGSRGTLTNGLEQSRKQLSAYIGSVNHQTL